MLTKIRRCLVKSSPLALFLMIGCLAIYFTLRLGFIFSSKSTDKEQQKVENQPRDVFKLDTSAFYTDRFLSRLGSFMTSILLAEVSQNKSTNSLTLSSSSLLKYIQTSRGSGDSDFSVSNSSATQANLFFNLCSNQTLNSLWIQKRMMISSSSMSNDTNRACFQLANHILRRYYKSGGATKQRRRRKAIKNSLIVMTTLPFNRTKNSVQGLSCLMNHTRLYWFSEIVGSSGMVVSATAAPSRTLPSKHGKVRVDEYDSSGKRLKVASSYLWLFDQLSDQSNDMFIDESLFIEKRSESQTWMMVYLASARKNRLPFYFDSSSACRQLKKLIVV